MKRNATRSVARMTARLVLALLVPASAVGTIRPPKTVPDDVRALLATDDMVLAYYKGDVTGAGTKGLVLVVYHGPVGGSGEGRVSADPCDLAVYEGIGGQWTETVRSDDAVDCTFNQLTDNPREMLYDDWLEVSPGSITWVNENIRSHVTFDFFYEKAKQRWFVQAMSQGARLPPKTPEGNVGFTYGEIVAPHDFPLTPMNELNRERLEPVLDKHMKTEY